MKTFNEFVESRAINERGVTVLDEPIHGSHAAKHKKHKKKHKAVTVLAEPIHGQHSKQ